MTTTATDPTTSTLTLRDVAGASTDWICLTEPTVLGVRTWLWAGRALGLTVRWDQSGDTASCVYSLAVGDREESGVIETRGELDRLLWLAALADDVVAAERMQSRS